MTQLSSVPCEITFYALTHKALKFRNYLPNTQDKTYTHTYEEMKKYLMPLVRAHSPILMCMHVRVKRFRIPVHSLGNILHKSTFKFGTRLLIINF